MNREALDILGLSPPADFADVRAAWLAAMSDRRGPCDQRLGDYGPELSAYLHLRHGAEGDIKMCPWWLDWVAVYVEEAASHANANNYRRQGEEIVAERGFDPEVWPEYAIAEAAEIVRREELGHAPDYIQHERLKGAPTCEMAAAIVEELVELREFSETRALYHQALIGDRGLVELMEPGEQRRRAAALFGIRWRVSPWTSKGSVVLATCQVLSGKDAALWSAPGKLPKWLLTFNLAAWLVMTELEQRRLLHHEMCHADFDPVKLRPKTRGHAIEENIETLARFGPLGGAQAAALHMGGTHERQGKLVEAAGWDKRGQGLLLDIPSGRG